LDPSYAEAALLALEHEQDLTHPAPFYPSALDDTIVGPWPLIPRPDDLTELGAAAPGAPRTPQQAIREGRRFIDEAVYVGVGYCLKTIRTLYGVGPVWPDAETAWEHATQRHPETDPARIPRGVPVWWTNGRYGHVALSVGG